MNLLLAAADLDDGLSWANTATSDRFYSGPTRKEP